MTDIIDYLERQARSALGRALVPAEMGALYKYLNLLIKWQKAQRLVGSSDPEWIVDNVIADSLLFTRLLSSRVAALCDVGSGAGIPGIPLAVVMSEANVTLIEARRKRVSFLAAAVRELPLRNCRVVGRRLEDARPELRRKFDAVVMRCAGNPAVVLPDVAPIIAPGGVVILSGPPEPAAVPVGSWVEVEGPRGPRRFWMHRVT